MFNAMLALTALAVLFGLILGYASRRFHVRGNPITDQIDRVLPQTQCGQCGYPGCRPYAEAIAQGETEINQCAPGGEATVLALADLLGREPPSMTGLVEKPKAIAWIDPQACIGCTLCLQACPVDAILGAAKQLHGVLSGECTGCERCLEPCPVDCIQMRPLPETPTSWKWPFPQGNAPGIARPQPA